MRDLVSESKVVESHQGRYRCPPDPTSACAPHCPDSYVSHTNFSTNAQTKMWISSSSTSLCLEAQSSLRRSPKFSFEAESFPLQSGHLGSMSDLFTCSVDLGPLEFYLPFDNVLPLCLFLPCHDVLPKACARKQHICLCRYFDVGSPVSQAGLELHV